MRILEQHINTAALINTVFIRLVPRALAHADDSGHDAAGDPGRDLYNAAVIENLH